MVIIGIIGVLAAVTAAVLPSYIKTAKADSGALQALDILRAGREMAISQRRNIRVVFSGTNTIQIIREDIGANSAVVGTTVLRTVELENRIHFYRFEAFGDTPDAFAPGTEAISFGTSLTRRFTSEGTFVNAAGDAMNGTLFIAVPEDKSTARAISFFGATALLRVWRWTGTTWVE
jgi:type II secretory pathway pseudopilin PulG